MKVGMTEKGKSLIAVDTCRAKDKASGYVIGHRKSPLHIGNKFQRNAEARPATSWKERESVEQK